MSYSYKTEKPFLFTDEGQRMFLTVRDNANRLSESAGAFTVSKVLLGIGGDSWKQLACVDRLVELKEFRYVYTDCVTQCWVLVKP